MKTRLVIGTRGSQLALWQARWVQQALENRHPDLTTELVIIKTKGDKILDVPLARVGGKGLFVTEIEDALREGRIDLAVHSMKDMPARIPGDLCIGAVPVRETPEDVFISHSGRGFKEMAPGAVIGTSSLRRAAQLRAARPDIKIRTIRGNLDTRLKKLDAKAYDAIVLAAAGVKRLQLTHRITEYLNLDVMLPAVGQGALCIETRRYDPPVVPLVAALNDPDTHTAITAERAFLNRLDGSCQTPVAAYARVENNLINMTGMVAGLDGHRRFEAAMSGPPETAEQMGIRLAEQLLGQGAREILDTLKALAND